MINKISIFNNNTNNSLTIFKMVNESLNQHNFIIDNVNPDLVIIIGGDGTFINALKQFKFNNDIIYVGIHTGHLGFLQEVKIEDIEQLFINIKNEDYKLECIGFENIEIISKKGIFCCNAFNEVLIREKDLKRINLNITIDDQYFEKFAGDGLMISTPVGSTAYNMSIGGSIVYPSINTLQITPIAPIFSQAYKSLRNSVIVPEKSSIIIEPEQDYIDKIKLTIDGNSMNFNNVNCINITISNNKIKMLRFKNYNFWLRINEKFLK